MWQSLFLPSRKTILSGPLYAKIMFMFKKIFTNILLICLSLTLLCGCSSSEKNKEFDAEDFVEDCRVLMPAGLYKNSTVKEYTMSFTDTVFEQFGKSDYYKNMSDSERFLALDQLCNVLIGFKYGVVEDGFIEGYLIDMKTHQVSWTLRCNPEVEMIWEMPGY